MNKAQHRAGIYDYNKRWDDWWDFKVNGQTRRQRVTNNSYWKLGILKQARALTNVTDGSISHRCLFPPARSNIRPRRPWPVDAGQPADFQP